jgi:SAM-dependent methyltransferase
MGDGRTIPPGCAACGGFGLEHHLAVAGDRGSEGLIPTTDRYGTALSDIVRCAACGHMQLESFPSSEELDSAYVDAESYDYVSEEAGQRATAAATLDRIERFAPSPGRLLDLGCWVGFLLAVAGERGWHAEGVEPSEFASRFAREELGLSVQTRGLFEADLDAGAFRVVFLGDVIEHLLEPVAALERVRELLEPGGFVALALPDSGSRIARLMGPRWWSVIPTHVQYFTRHSLRVALERAGLEPLGGSTAPKAFTVRYYLDRLAGYSPRLATTAVRLAEAVGIAERLWAPDFHDRMLVLGRARTG